MASFHLRYASGSKRPSCFPSGNLTDTPVLSIASKAALCLVDASFTCFFASSTASRLAPHGVFPHLFPLRQGLRGHLPARLDHIVECDEAQRKKRKERDHLPRYDELGIEASLPPIGL